MGLSQIYFCHQQVYFNSLCFVELRVTVLKGLLKVNQMDKQQSDGTVLHFIDGCFLFQLKILLINFIFGWNNTLCPNTPLCMLVLLKCNKQ